VREQRPDLLSNPFLLPAIPHLRIGILGPSTRTVTTTGIRARTGFICADRLCVSFGVDAATLAGGEIVVGNGGRRWGALQDEGSRWEVGLGEAESVPMIPGAAINLLMSIESAGI